MPEQDVVIKRIAPVYTLYVRQIAPTPNAVGEILGECFGAMMGQGTMPVAPPMTIFYDEGFVPVNMDIAIAFPVDASVKGEIALVGGRALKPVTLPEMATAACILHHDDYERLGQSYAALGAWIESNGYRVAGRPREVYLTAPEEGKVPLTEIQFPVEKE